MTSPNNLDPFPKRSFLAGVLSAAAVLFVLWWLGAYKFPL
jgi:hypothetical protein